MERQDRILFVNPSGQRALHQLGGQGLSVVAYSDNGAEAWQYMKWFAQPTVQKKWWSSRLLLPQGRVERPGLPCERTVSGDFLVSMNMVRTSGPEPSTRLLLDMQKRIR